MPQLSPGEGEPENGRLAPGERLGRYTVRAFVGAGGMGEVYAGHDPELDRDVALKVLRPGVVGRSPEARARFQREAQAMARLNHPNVVSVHDVDTIGDRVFVAMELVRGPTLSEWLAEDLHPWREVIDVFLAAGRGLEAAHAAGIVHRDFKPANVILGDRVRVADFGLARGASEPAETPARGDSILDTAVTQTGERLGTPAYMAPEQRAGEPATAASDQYAFAVALHEAIHGVRPGAGAPRRAAPAWLRAIVQRGLAPRPAERYPSMTALLADLARDPARARRRALLAAAAVVLLSGAAIAFALGRRQAEIAACDSGAALAAEVWNDAARARVREAFASTGLPYAADSFARVDAKLGDRLAGWAASHRDACLATHVRREQSEALLDLRMQCLERARFDAVTFVRLLEKADRRAVDRAVAASVGVADPAPCADVAALTAIVPPPHDPAVAKEDGALHLEAGRVRALLKLGRYKEAIAGARELAPRARSFSYAPAVAVALDAACTAESSVGDVEAGIELCYAAAKAAEEAHDDATRASILSRLIFTLGYQRDRIAEAAVVAHLAEGAVERAGNDPGLLLLLFHGQVALIQRQGDYARALAYSLAELAAGIRATGWPSKFAAAGFTDMCIQEKLLGRYGAARAACHEAVRVIEDALGPAHPDVAAPLANDAQVAMHFGDVRAADEEFHRALALREAADGPDHERVASVLVDLCNVQIAEGHDADARASIERALGIYAARHVDNGEVWLAEARLAEVQAREGHAADAVAAIDRVIQRAAKLNAEKLDLAELDVLRADFLRRAGRLPEARAGFERALAVYASGLADHPDTAVPSARLASVLLAQGETARARALCARSLALAHDSFLAGSSRIVEIEELCR